MKDLLASDTQIVDLSRPMVVGMPQSPNHPEYRLSMPRRHGDKVRADGGSAANDLLVSGTHVGTHIDALGHVSHCGELHGGVDADAAQAGGRLNRLGVEEIAPILARGVLLDVAALHGVDVLAGGHEITPDELDAACDRVGVRVGAGDVILIRSGWGRHWDDAEAFVGRETGVPGVGEAGARWCAAREPVAVGADTIAFECIRPGEGHATLPAHRVLLVEAGVYIIETMALDELAALDATEFAVVVAPLHLVGATGSPVRPLAILGG
ncbi:MAG TPA: cyclase family protein [Microthrixaceae bacterium]|nr:cyclase family protein [Microthrixaceae bacterium]